MGGLIQELGTQLRPSRELVDLAVPHGESAVIARLHEVAQVLERDYAGEAARFKARLSPHYRARIRRLHCPAPKSGSGGLSDV